jgi:hypothetical protein
MTETVAGLKVFVVVGDGRGAAPRLMWCPGTS